MARRRRQLIDDSDPETSSGESEELDDPDEFDRQGFDPDREAEEELFRDPYQTGRRKRRRRNDDGFDAKEDAIYGTFAHASDDEARGRGGSSRGRGRGRGRGGAGSASLRRPQAFVSSTSTAQPSNPVEDAPPLADVDAEAENMDATMDISSGSSAWVSSASDAESEEDEVAPAEEAAPDDLPPPESRSGLGAATSHAGLGSTSRVGLGAASASPAGSANYAAAKMFAKAGLGSKDASTEDNDSAGAGARGGLGSAGSRTGLGASAGLGAGARAGLGGGLGSGGAHRSIRQLMEEQAPSPATSAEASPAPTPAAERRSFLGAVPPPSAAGPSVPAKAAFKLSREEERHFAKISTSSSVGAKLLARMGWTSGSGLGAKGEGIVTPIESKLRPKGAGLNYGGFGERTKQAKEEDRRRGKVTSDDEEEEKSRRRKGTKLRTSLDPSRAGTPTAERRPDAWKRPAKPKKASVVHKTYEEVLASGATVSGLDNGIGQIVDLTGQALPSLQSTLSMNVTAPTEEDKRSLPELRHNLRLLCDTSKAEVQGLAREGKALQERKKWAAEEAVRAKQRRLDQAGKRKRLEQIVEVAKEVGEVSKRAAGVDEEPEKLLAWFEAPFEKLLGGFEQEYEEMRLDEVAVAGIAPILRRAWIQWQPLQQPTHLVPELKRWRKVLRLQKAVDISTAGRANGHLADMMTAFEALLWTQWLPRVRSAVNTWSPTDAGPLVDLFVAWRPLLPQFLQDNIFDQLVLPKVSAAIADWDPRSTSTGSLHGIVFPWLEHAGRERMEDILDQSKRRVRGWLGSWRAKDGVPKGLAVWRDVFSKKDWDSLMLKTAVPTLGAYLRDHFKVDPRDQDLAPLRVVLPWRSLLRRSIFTQLLQTGFFAKWLDTLWIWLAHSPDYDQINTWFAWWKAELPEDVVALRGVEDGFARGTEMIHQARSLSSLGMSIKERLAQPDLDKRPLGTSSSRTSTPIVSPGSTPRRAVAGKTAAPARQVEEVTFRSLVEEEAAKENLILLPTGRSLETTGAPLFRVSQNVDGKNGVTIYLEDDVVYVQEGAEWEPMMVEDMLAKAKA